MFKLTEEEEKTSINTYGKIIKCIIAPYHNIVENQRELAEVIGDKINTTYVFPERDLTIQQRKGLISTLVNSKLDEVTFVTSDLFIITDMVAGCCRLLTPSNKLVNLPVQTFSANAHDILLKVLSDKNYDEENSKNKSFFKDRVNKIITKINDLENIGVTDDQRKSIRDEIETISEPVLSGKLKSMLSHIKSI